MICQVIQTEMCGYHNYTLDHGSYMLPVAEQLCSTNHDSPYIEHRQTDQTTLAMATEFHPPISEPLTGPGSYQLCNTDRNSLPLRLTFALCSTSRRVGVTMSCFLALVTAT